MKTKMSKVVISYLLTLCLFVGILPITALPVIATPSTEGTFGEVVTEDGIHFKKSLVTDLGENQPEVLKIEAWVDGEITTGESNPADIILVLDQSGSMDDTLAGSETAKLQAMKNAVEAFVASVASNNTENNDKYRVAIVGFASEDENTELLTTESPVLYNAEYKKVSDGTAGLDTSKTYYIKSGSSYDEIRYYTPFLASDGWYEVGLLGLRGDAVASNAVIYESGAISEETYRNTFVNCTDTSIASGGRIYNAIDALDGNGATRADLGFEMARNIFASQDSDTYSEGREKIVVFLTDGVPTTSNDFSASVAEDAIVYAKEMKDADAHIFSLFLGTAGTADSVNFMQGISSNYPEATNYTALGDKAADSYYSSHTDTAAITDVFTDIAISVSSHSKLDENSIIADSLSDYFTLPSVDSDGSFNESQIYVYTVEWTGTAWATENVGGEDVEKRVRFNHAKVEIDDATKEVRVSGFNFKHHCITSSPKDGASDYGRKLVFYIPILEDQSADTFGGYLPTNDRAYIKETSTSTENAVEAEGCMHDTQIKYHLQAGTHLEHFEDNTADPVFFYNEDADGDGTTNMNEVLKHMINELPDGTNNIGVDITYTLFDESDTAVATITVPAGESYEDVGLLDFASWNPIDASMTLPAWVDETSTYIFELEATLTSKEAVSSPQELKVHQNLHVTLTKDETTHIVNGAIDENGEISVASGAAGVLNTAKTDYTELVGEGEYSAEMTFTPNFGHYITKIEITTWHNSEHSIIYDLTDEDSSNDALPSGMSDIKGAFVYTAGPIEGGVVVDVSTSPIMYALTSTAENAMISPDSPNGTYKYSHHNSEKLKVDFAALEGYRISSITVDGTPYDLGELPIEGLSVNTEDGHLVSGEITLDRLDVHSVSVSAEKRMYNLKFVQYKRIYDVTGYTYEIYDAGTSVPTEFGAQLTSPVPAVGEPGNPTDIDSTEYVFKNWYKIADIKADNTGEFRQLTVVANEKMPASDLTLYGFWEATPNQEIGTVNIKKKLDGPVSDAFNFVAVMEEHIIGSLELAVPPDDEATGTITPKLSEAQEHQFHNGDVNIYVYEVDDGTGEYLFDKTRYVLKTDGASGFKLYNVADDTTELSEAEFNNVENSFTVKYDLSGGTIGGNPSIPDNSVKWEEKNLLPDENPQKTGFKFMGWVYNEEFISNNDSYSFLAQNNTATKEITLVAYYEGDTIGENPDPHTPDGIPDKYQKMITYRIINGTWDGAKTDDIIEVVTLKDAGGNPSESGSAVLSKVPDETGFVRIVGDAGDGEGWAENPAPTNGTVVSGIEPLTFTYIFHNKPDVEYPKHEPDEPVPVVAVDPYEDEEDILVNPNGGIWEFGGTTYPVGAKAVLNLTENIELGEATREGFVFSGWTKTDPTEEDKSHPGASNIVAVYTAQWDADEIGGDPNPHDSDDIADKYQKKITFKILNGKWENGTAADEVYVVDLLTVGNKYAEHGSADISGIIPVNMTADPGYEGGSWDVTPPEKVTGSGAVTYTYTFTQIPSNPGGGGGGTTRYTLTYETNGGTPISKETYARNTNVKLTKVPKKDGYVFEGWYLDKELTESVNEVKMTKNITVYAAWVEDNGNAGGGGKTPDKLNDNDHFAYVVGYPDGTVKPDANITRAEAVSIFFRLLKDGVRENYITEVNNYTDVNDGDWYNTAISTMLAMDIATGRTETEFMPNEYITRAEFAVLCARFDDTEYVITDEFTDIAEHWAEDDIHEAAAHGWIRGYNDNTFKPDALITRAEAMTLINRVLNRVPETPEDLLSTMIKWPDNSDTSVWYYLPVQEATNSHEYDMKNHVYERWTALREVADWTKYE